MRAFRPFCLILGLWAGAAAATEPRIVVDPADETLTRELRAASLTVATAAQDDARPADLLAAARADYARLIGVLYAQGYFSPVIRIRVDGREAAALPPFEAPSEIGRIELSVTPGPRFSFGVAKVAPLAAGTELPEGFAPGGLAASTLISDAARAGIDGWRDAGHAKAALAGQSVVADHRTATLDAEIRLAPGPQLRFGALQTDGSNRTRPERIRAIAGLPEGEVFSPSELRDSADRLRRSGAFRSVTLREAEAPNPDGSLDIEAILVDDKKRRLGFGAEISSLEGLSLSAYWLHRNLFRGAERLRLDAGASGIGGDTGGVDLRSAASLTRPATFDPDTSLTLLGETELLNEPDFFERKINLEAGLKHRFSDTLEARAGVGLRYAEVNDDLGARSFTHLTLPIGATWDRRRDALNPTGGFFVDVEGEPFVALSGGASGARLYADGRVYRGLGGAGPVVLAGRIQVGSVLAAGPAEVPPDMLFFSGGGGTVRGQPYQSLGVDLPGGDRVGGRSFLGLSGELRVGVTDKIGVVGFADAGFVGAGSTPGGDGEWHSGAGLGLRYDTGIGPLRLDVAAPVGGNTGSGVQFYIGIGQAF